MFMNIKWFKTDSVVPLQRQHFVAEPRLKEVYNIYIIYIYIERDSLDSQPHEQPL